MPHFMGAIVLVECRDLVPEFEAMTATRNNFSRGRVRSSTDEVFKLCFARLAGHLGCQINEQQVYVHVLLTYADQYIYQFDLNRRRVRLTK